MGLVPLLWPKGCGKPQETLGWAVGGAVLQVPWVGKDREGKCQVSLKSRTSLTSSCCLTSLFSGHKADIDVVTDTFLI